MDTNKKLECEYCGKSDHTVEVVEIGDLIEQNLDGIEKPPDVFEIVCDDCSELWS